MDTAQSLSDSGVLVSENQAFRAYHEFLRGCRQFVDAELSDRLHEEFDETYPGGETPQLTTSEALDMVGPLPSYQMYSWMYRRLQQFKYHWPEYGLVEYTDAQRKAVEAKLDDSAAQAGERLRLNPELELPDYFQMVDFHQHPGGVASDTLDGVVYELGRRTTVPQHADPNRIYHILFDQIPDADKCRKVLDWGTGHGAGLIEFKQRFPQADCYGVDLSAPCLKLAHYRSAEAGLEIHYSQQDIEHMDFDDGSFDLVFGMFMWHEIPPQHYPAILRELYRVLAPGGRFATIEFHVNSNSALQRALQVSHGWLNNETYAGSWYSAPMEQLATDAGFSNAEIERCKALTRQRDHSSRTEGLACWNLYLFEK